MKYKIIASDMDGTLLNDDKNISNYNLAMINKATSLGVKFVIASGRVPATLKFYEETIGKNQPIICANGAIVLDHNKNIIYSNPISKSNLIKIINILREDKDTYYHFYDGNVFCSEQFEYSAKKFYNFNRKVDQKYRMEIRLIKDAKDYIIRSNSNIDKIVVMDDDVKYLEYLRCKIDNLNEIETTKSEINNLEIMGIGSSKGTALKLLAKYYEIPIEQCIAIGNDENDISMIKAAGVGISMANGRNSLKQYANYITEKNNNNGGIGEIIEKFILNI
ncbi:HAD family hydrolase [Clostridium carboxidivorans P7]|uniref:Cof-like hydrolase n=1 Tax=Clostridium carboxidivorans P7 TaxID=536227 RepID=C6PUS4_9CLOT|nr:Cof-type HAD-IIB family hydrolase [Clostridium carboxidivorans]AKN29337.1 HAD family hydrolase [Clostridium carboxidivorans P7]EET87003.1 Cof-like hydrolase [Clostridium carboxidivorans P7]EFG89752.1 Cof-like hydrolase [Clostridium carboxidivorans P7]